MTVKMIDISAKTVVERTAVAKGELKLKPATITAIKENNYDIITKNDLSTEQVTALEEETNTNEADLKKDWDGKANKDAENILEGAAKSVQELTGIQREQGQKKLNVWKLRESGLRAKQISWQDFMVAPLLRQQEFLRLQVNQLPQQLRLHTGWRRPQVKQLASKQRSLHTLW